MRELSGKDDEKLRFELSRQLFFDGENTGITIPARAIQELVEDIASSENVHMINEIMREIDKQFNLTDEELNHNTKNFRRLIGI